MSPAIEPVENSDDDAMATARPRASYWLWRPLHAKLWWAAILVYWAGKLTSFYVAALDEFYTSALAGFLNILFYPFVALMVLGVRFVPVWMDYHGWEWVAPSKDRTFQDRSVGGFLDPMADPLDPRSPRHWHRYDNH